MVKTLYYLGSIIFLTSCSSVKITDKPIRFDQERVQLTLDYMLDRYGIVQTDAGIRPEMVVVHWTEIPDFEKSFNAFYNNRLPNWRPDLKNAGPLNVSAQFLVDRDGTIYRLLPENTMARHVIGLNHCAIGIENVGGTEETPLTWKQLKANVRLIKYLKKKYPAISYVIGHYEYTLFEDHPLWLEKDETYRTEKTDPGVEFMTDIRNKTKKYHWEPVPKKK
ncbi:MAG: peptidoglycan recognition family protein [Flavobacteriaceae bacterium]|nr:peptidoglycan recognition family protein [Flavobacteriaceae bacterium]